MLGNSFSYSLPLVHWEVRKQYTGMGSYSDQVLKEKKGAGVVHLINLSLLRGLNYS